jgi:CO/xanthine dehydrogenase Mo-binding subunit
MAAAIHSGGNTFLNTESEIELRHDGVVVLRTGIPDLGTEQETTQRLMAARELGMPPDQLDVIWADTQECPHDFGIFTSSSTTAKGAATVETARAFRRRLIELGAELLGVAEDELIFDDARVQVRDNPAVGLSLAELAARATGGGQPLKVSRGPDIPRHIGFFSFATNFVEVEVDVRTGAVKVLRILTTLDVGQPMNPLLLSGQMRSATLQGISYAMYEGVRFDTLEKGVPLTAGFLDYKLPSFVDDVTIECHTVDSYEPYHPMGAKGAGELAMNPTAPAIANAIYNATGVRIFSTPITPDQVLRRLREEGVHA